MGGAPRPSSYPDPDEFRRAMRAWKEEKGLSFMEIRIDEQTYRIRPADHGTIALAGFLAMSRGEVVDIPLSDGTVIKGKRFAEIEMIAEQVLTR